MDGLRILNRVISMLLALALLVAGILVAVEIVLAALEREPWALPHDRWYADGRQTAWSDGDARVLFGVLLAVGLVLLLLELLRRRAEAVGLADLTEGTTADLDRRGLERWLAARLDDVEGASGTRVKVTRKAVAVSAATPGRDAPDVQTRLDQAASARLDELGLAAPLRVRTKVTSRRPS